MPIHDISHTLSMQSPEWPEQPPLDIHLCSKIADGEIANLTHLNMVAHMGTHIDAPCHFVDGAGSIEDLPLDSLIGPAVVLDLPDVELITADILKKAQLPAGTERVLFKTRNSAERLLEKKAFEKNYVSLDAESASYLVEQGIKLVGIDYMSIAPFDAPIPTHQILLKASVVIVEALNLVDIKAGNYTLYCLPIKIAGADGAPTRAILID